MQNFNICYYVLYISNSNMSWKYLFIAIPSSFALPTVLALFSHELIEKDSIIKVDDLHKIFREITQLQVKSESLKEGLKEAHFELLSKIDIIEKEPQNLLRGKELTFEHNGTITKVKVK